MQFKKSKISTETETFVRDYAGRIKLLSKAVFVMTIFIYVHMYLYIIIIYV